MSLSKTEFGTFDDLVAGLDPEIERIARRLRTLILDVHPDAVEVVRLGDSDVRPHVYARFQTIDSFPFECC